MTNKFYADKVSKLTQDLTWNKFIYAKIGSLYFLGHKPGSVCQTKYLKRQSEARNYASQGP